MKEKIARVKYPISLKLIIIISTLVIVSLGTVTTLVTIIIRNDVELTAEQNNHTINAQVSTLAEKDLLSARANAFLLMNTLSAMGSEANLAVQYANLFFERNQTIAAVLIPDTIELVNNHFFTANELEQTALTHFLEQQSASIERCTQGEVIATNATSQFGVPTVALMYPWKENGKDESLIIVFSVEALTESFASGTNSSFMINDTNDILIHPDMELVKIGVNISNLSLIKQMRTNNDINRQVLFTDENGVEYFGAYTKLSVADIGVITVIESDLVFEGVNATIYQNSLLAIAVLSLAILFTWFFSKSISKPIRALAKASMQIEKGNFIVDIQANNHDEIGLLTEQFVNMGKGLAERERLKDTFGRFTNKEIAEQAMKGELKLGGETKQATIFFSDIRSFTAISEKLEPFEVIEF